MKRIAIMLLLASGMVAANVLPSAADSMQSSSMMATMPKCAAGDPVVGMNMMTKMYMTHDQIEDQDGRNNPVANAGRDDQESREDDVHVAGEGDGRQIDDEAYVGGFLEVAFDRLLRPTATRSIPSSSDRRASRSLSGLGPRAFRIAFQPLEVSESARIS